MNGIVRSYVYEYIINETIYGTHNTVISTRDTNVLIR